MELTSGELWAFLILLALCVTLFAFVVVLLVLVIGFAKPEYDKEKNNGTTTDKNCQKDLEQHHISFTRELYNSRKRIRPLMHASRGQSLEEFWTVIQQNTSGPVEEDHQD